MSAQMIGQPKVRSLLAMIIASNYRQKSSTHGLSLIILAQLNSICFLKVVNTTYVLQTCGNAFTPISASQWTGSATSFLWEPVVHTMEAMGQMPTYAEITVIKMKKCANLMSVPLGSLKYLPENV